MSFNQTNPNFANYQNSQLQAQGINPAPFPQIPYKPTVSNTKSVESKNGK